jgi:hypothetical protein
MSGVAVGEGLEGNGDASAGGFSFNEDGTRINESNESLAGVGDGVGVGEVAVSCAVLGCDFVAVASVREVAPDRCSEMSLRSFFFGSVAADGASNLPCTIIPDSLLETA